MQPVKLWLPPTRDGPPLGRTRQGTEDSVELAMAHLEDWDAGPPLGEKSWEKKTGETTVETVTKSYKPL